MKRFTDVRVLKVYLSMGFEQIKLVNISTVVKYNLLYQNQNHYAKVKHKYRRKFFI